MKGKNLKIKARIGSTLLIVGLLVGSAMLRVAIGATQAMAKSDAPAVPAQSAETEESQKKPSMPAVDTTTLLAALKQREERVAEQEMKLEMRQKALEVAQHEIERRIEAMKQAEDRLRATLTFHLMDLSHRLLAGPL